MIRNHAGDPVKSTARLIETLKKVGIIKTKKRRAKRSLATSDEIRQDNDMGPGFATSMQKPPQFVQGGPTPLLLQGGQQGGFNQSQIEDIQRTYNQQIGMLQDQVQRQSEEQRRIQNMGFALGGAVSYLQQRLDRPVTGVSEPVDPFRGVKGSGDDVEPAKTDIPDTEDQEPDNVGPNRVPDSVEQAEISQQAPGFAEEETVFIPPEPDVRPPQVETRLKSRKAKTPIGSFLSKATFNELDRVGVARPNYKAVPELEATLYAYATQTGQRVPDIDANVKISESGRTEDKVETIKRLLTRLINSSKR